jgi:hypothetical protein
MTRFLALLAILALSLIVAAPAVYIIGRLTWHIAEIAR